MGVMLQNTRSVLLNTVKVMKNRKGEETVTEQRRLGDMRTDAMRYMRLDPETKRGRER